MDLLGLEDKAKEIRVGVLPLSVVLVEVVEVGVEELPANVGSCTQVTPRLMCMTAKTLLLLNAMSSLFYLQWRNWLLSL